MEGLRSQRKNIIEQCTIDEIPLPKKGVARGKGVGAQEGSEPDNDQDDEMEVEAGSCIHSQSAIQAKAEIAKDRLDYSRLSRDHRRDMSEKEQSKVRNQVEEELAKAAEIINSMNPNMKAIDQLKEVEVRYQAVTDESKAAKENSQHLSKEFETVKQKRCDLFNRWFAVQLCQSNNVNFRPLARLKSVLCSCFEHVKGCIDVIYKELTSDPTRVEQSVGGSAYLTLNNQDEPYLDGIKYDTIPPGKRFMDMQNLSGGEQTIAALAILFAINSYSPAPFIVLDEVI
jgi:structural maintenance of chromosome 1